MPQPTTVTVRPTADAAEAICAQVGHAVRRFGKQRQDYPRPPIAFQRAELFLEPLYADGQPSADDDAEDEADAKW
jgi:hypothetical protein